MSSESGQYSARLLRSENGMFILQFDYSLRNTQFDSVEKDIIRNIYMGIWYNTNLYSGQPVWIAKQNSPNLGYGGLLTIDDKDGCFKISTQKASSYLHLLKMHIATPAIIQALHWKIQEI
ncbi:hypothetical protein LINGRAHAP2_LOCUS31004 [Linum grandiflorum]